MKKFSAIILAVFMVMLLLPTSFAAEAETQAASEVSVKYNFKDSYDATIGTGLADYTPEKVNGFWSGEHVCNTFGKTGTAGTHLNTAYGLFVRNKGSWAAVKINVPVSGVYNKITIHTSADVSATTDLDIYLADDVETFTENLQMSSLSPIAENVSFYKLYVDNENKAYTGTFDIEISKYLEAGEHKLVFYAEAGKADGTNTCQAKIYHLTLSGGTGLSPVIKSITAPETLTAGESGTVTATAFSKLSNCSTDAENVTFTYSSSDDAVAKVSADGTISAIAGGSAEITVTATSASSKATHSATRTVTVNVTAPEVETSPKTSLWIGDNIDGKNVTVMIGGEEKTSETLLSEERGLSVKAIANAPAGYIFRGWVRGSAERGVWVSSEPEYTFVTTTHSMITAVFEEATDGDVIEYYNENGAYIETRSALESAPTGSEIPSLVGCVFDDWYVSETIKLSDAVLGSLTRAVAKHTPVDTNATITSDGTPISTTDFDSEVENIGTNDTTCWKRNGEIVSYGKDYTYYVWGNTEIESSKEALPVVKEPIIYLDPVAYSNGARMIEYDKGDFEIVEVGILFGEEGATPVITSCIEKMNSQRNSDHGQFTATPSDASYTARGYMIYRDGTEYKVIYSK